jgi:hypothetical protein
MLLVMVSEAYQHLTLMIDEVSLSKELNLSPKIEQKSLVIFTVCRFKKLQIIS